MNETKQTELRVRPRRTELAASKSDIEWVKTPKKHWQERLLPNLAIASALMLCAVALKTGAIPPLTDAVQSVMSAATDDSLLNGDLGKLSFVSSIFPEASLVFGESGGKLTMPVEAASVVHAWSQSEPFISWDAQTKIVTSAMAGEVIGVYHGNEDERLVQVLGTDGLSCLYGNLASVTVSTGDMVQTGDPLGTLMAGQPCVMEVRQDGLSVDPAVMMRQ